MTQSARINNKHTKISTTTYNKSMLAIYCSIAITVTGCSTLPKHTIESIPETTLQVDTTQTTLAQIIQPLQEQHPELTGYLVLFEPLEALSARLHQLFCLSYKTLSIEL